MTIRIPGAPPTPPVNPPETAAAKEAHHQPVQVQAIEPQEGIEEPEPAHYAPSPDEKSSPSRMQKRVNRLLKDVRHPHPNQMTAAKEALLAAASYTLRRSKGARRYAMELCVAVAESVEELAGSANALRDILEAEGYLHETTMDGTLRAIALLTQLMEPEAELEG